jgi:hypothetical protein
MSASPIWTLLYAGTEQSLADWGIEGAQISRRSLSPDQLTGSFPGRALDAAPVFAFGATITLKRAGVAYFLGRVQQPSTTATIGSEAQTFLVEGPWTWLEHVVYLQTWAVQGLKSRLHLFSGATAQQQVIAALAYAISGGAPLQVGTIDLTVQPPAEETADLTCAAVITRALRWQPDRVGWFDYATTPPTFHVTRRANLTELSLAIGTDPLEGISLTPRHDLRVPSVTILQEQESQSGALSLYVDQYPVGANVKDYGALVATISLRGFRGSWLTQEIETYAMINSGTDQEGLQTWASNMMDWYQAELAVNGEWGRIREESNVNIHDVKFVLENGLEYAEATDQVRPSVYPRTLMMGTIQPWMLVSGGGPVNAFPGYVELQMDYDLLTEIGVSPVRVLRSVKNEIYRIPVIITNATTKTYSQQQVADPGESPYAGLAQAIYDALEPLQFAGSVSLHETECGSRQILGRRLNLTNGPAAWATMDAMISEVIERLDNGRTEIKVGPPPYLTISDVIQLLQATRSRVSPNRSEFASGQATGQGGLTLGKYTRESAGNAGAGEPLEMSFEAEITGTL